MDKEPMIWAFDLGKCSIGEAVRQGTECLDKASLLIAQEFGETKTAAGRRRMARTREAHRERENWLDEIFRRAEIPDPSPDNPNRKLPLAKKHVDYVDYQTREAVKSVKNRRTGEKRKRLVTIKFGGKWKTVQEADPRLRREFRPCPDITAQDGPIPNTR